MVVSDRIRGFLSETHSQIKGQGLGSLPGYLSHRIARSIAWRVRRPYQTVRSSAKWLLAHVLDSIGVDHGIWVESRPYEYQVSKRLRRSLRAWGGLPFDPAAPARVVLIADSADIYVLQGYLSWCLWLRGVPNAIVVCDGGLPVCDAKSVARPEVSCSACFGKNEGQVKAFGLSSLKVGRYVPGVEVEDAVRAVSGLSWAECGAYTYDGTPLGKLALVSLCVYFRVGEVRESEAALAVFRRFLATGLVMSKFHSRLLDDLKPERVVLLNGLYLGWRIAYEQCRRRGIGVSTWELGHTPNTLVLAEEDFALYYDSLASTWRAHYRDKPLPLRHRMKVEKYLASRNAGGSGLIVFNINYNSSETLLDDAKLRERLRISPAARVYTAFTNVEWDSAVVDRHAAFERQWDWIAASIGYFAGRKDTDLVIRVHPGEGILPGLESMQRIGERIRANFEPLPGTVHLVDWADKINSYSLLGISEAALVYTSTIGLEAACMGKPVVVAGKTHYAGNGFTLDARTPAEFAERLDRVVERSDAGVNRDLALSYAHLFFFRAMIPYGDMLRMEELFQITSFPTRDFTALEQGRHPRIDLLCDILLGKREPLLPDEFLDGMA